MKKNKKNLILRINFESELSLFKKINERFKTYNAFINQLKINKIEFNKFLHEK